MEPIDFVYLGGCLLSAPVNELLREGRLSWALRRAGLRRAAAIYTLGEAIQFTRFLRGDLDIPPEIRLLSDIDRDWVWQPQWRACLAETDVVLVEINSPVPICYGSYSLNRASIITHIGEPLVARRPDLKAVANDWYYQGIMNANNEVRIELGLRLADSVPDDMVNADLARRIFTEAYGLRQKQEDFVEGIALLRDIIGRPIIVVTAVHRYLPDGRRISYWSDAVDHTIAAAQTVGLPVFQPSEVVTSYGLNRAMKEDLSHYREEFHPVLGAALYEAIAEVVKKDQSVVTRRIEAAE